MSVAGDRHRRKKRCCQCPDPRWTPRGTSNRVNLGTQNLRAVSTTGFEEWRDYRQTSHGIYTHKEVGIEGQRKKFRGTKRESDIKTLLTTTPPPAPYYHSSDRKVSSFSLQRYPRNLRCFRESQNLEFKIHPNFRFIENTECILHKSSPWREGNLHRISFHDPVPPTLRPDWATR